MSPLETSSIIFSCIFGGSILGMWLRSVIPEHHLDAETKDLVKLGVGLIGTMAALLLGLLVASAKSSFDTRSSEVTQMAANVILLDRALAHYGPETGELRGMLGSSFAQIIDQVWSKDDTENMLPAQGSGNILYDKIQELVPHSDAQRALQSQAESILVNFGQTRLLIFAQSGTSISTPFLVVVVFWLSMLFVSFGLFAPRNVTAIVTLLVAAISVAAALYLILELDHPFSGLIQISSDPLRNALSLLGK
ncbi:MAG: DUF4239 domain-containing protein [Deltaproteobacteria bacterium]|nr:DUF4239 domain-containing protein [Deltaproteobacteria bacterium]